MQIRQRIRLEEMAVRLDLPENALLRGGTVLVVLKVDEAQPPVAVRFLGSARSWT